MTVFANVNGENKELYRIFFNDNGVIREVESFHAQNDNNEIKELFVRDSNAPSDLQWVAYDGDSSTINSVTNNGYTISGTFTSRKRSVETANKIFLPAGAKIRIELSNAVFDTDDEIRTTGNVIYLFNTESATDYVQDVISLSSSNTMTVKNTGDYYITLSMYGIDASGNTHHCTTDVDVYILPPIGLQWVAYNGDDESDSSTINSVTNNGYTINGRFTDKKRSISTIYKKRLLFNTKIRVELSNTKYDTDVVVSDRVYIYLFDTESFSDHAQYSYSTGSPATMNVMNTGDYYIALCVYGRDSSGNNHYCTTDANITILPPK